jgi:hypothetical protein
METGQGENNKLKLTSEQCGPGCDCGKPAGNKKMKMAVFLLVILAACGVIFYKTAIAKTEAPPAGKNTAFSASAGNQGTAADFQAQKTWAGEPLDSMMSLNNKAVNKNAVFICIPAPKDGTIKKETVDAINEAIRNLKSHGINAGLYTLKPGSLDYAEATSKTPPPDVIVISRGGGAIMVAGKLTETNLMQAYVASTRSGGCGSSCGGKCN